MTMKQRTDYPYIRAWGRMMGSLPYYVEAQVEKARADRAPQNAIYFNEGVWETFDDVTNSLTRFQMENILDNMGAR